MNRINYAFLAASMTLALVLFFHPALGDFGAFISGTPGDPRFVLSTLEHWRNAALGDADWATLPVFHPLEGTMGRSDLHFAHALAYGIYRSAGADMFLAYQLTLMTLVAVGAAGSFIFARKILQLTNISALAAAILAVAANSAVFHGPVHAQLLGVCLVPWIGLATHRMLIAAPGSKASIGYGLILGLLLALLLATSVYITLFLIQSLTLFCVIFASLRLIQSGPTVFANQCRQLISNYWRAALGTFAAVGLLATPVVWIYLLNLSGDSPFSAFQDVASKLPTIYDWFYLERFNLVYAKVFETPLADPLGRNRLNELSFGVTPILLGLFAAATGYWGYAALRSGTGGIRASLIASAASTVWVLWMLLVKVEGFSLWTYVYDYFPGAFVIRSPFRIQILLNFLVACVAMAFVDCVLRRARRLDSPTNRLLLRVAMYGLLVFTVVEQINIDQFKFRRQVELARLSKFGPPPGECRFFLLNDPDGTRSGRLPHLDAQLMAVKYGLPTIMGVTGRYPDGWGLHRSGASDNWGRVVSWLRAKGVADETFCVADLKEGIWKMIGNADVALRQFIPPLRLGQWLDFTSGGNSENYLAGDDWTGAGSWGRWTTNDLASLIVPIESVPGGSIAMEIDAAAFFFGDHDAVSATVLINGIPIGDITFTKDQDPPYEPNRNLRRLTFDAALLRDGWADVGFAVANPRSPMELNKSGDPRRLGLAVHRLRFAEASDPHDHKQDLRGSP